MDTWSLTRAAPRVLHSAFLLAGIAKAPEPGQHATAAEAANGRPEHLGDLASASTASSTASPGRYSKPTVETLSSPLRLGEDPTVHKLRVTSPGARPHYFAAIPSHPCCVMHEAHIYIPAISSAGGAASGKLGSIHGALDSRHQSCSACA